MRNTKVRSLSLAALFAALTAVCAQIQIPLPMIPLNLALFSVYLCGALLGAKYGAASMGVYLLLGLIGAPVFAGMGAGPAVLFGKTGGYIFGYIFAAMITGLCRERWGFSFGRLCLGMAAGTLACYALGTAYFMWIAHMNLLTSLSYCVFPFLPGDAVKIALAAWLAVRLSKTPLLRG